MCIWYDYLICVYRCTSIASTVLIGCRHATFTQFMSLLAPAGGSAAVTTTAPLLPHYLSPVAPDTGSGPDLAAMVASATLHPALATVACCMTASANAPDTHIAARGSLMAFSDSGPARVLGGESSTNGAQGCTSPLDCSLNGLCVAGACHCDTVWLGLTCKRMALVPSACASRPHTDTRSTSAAGAAASSVGTSGYPRWLRTVGSPLGSTTA